MNPPTVLLVEDNEDDEALIRRALSKSNVSIQLVVLHDGVEAIEYLLGPAANARSSPDWPCLLLLDLKMPRMGGLEVLEKLRSHERTRLMPIVIFTSSNEEQDILNGYRLGAFSYVRKPIDFLVLSQTIQKIVDYWTCINEPPPPPTGSPSSLRSSLVTIPLFLL